LPSTIDSLYRQAVGHLSAGRPGPARELGTQLLRAAPDHAGGLHLLGFLELQANRPQAALTLLERSCQRDGSNATALVHLATAYALCGRWSSARPVLERVVVLQPAMVDAWLKLADVLEHLGDHVAAGACYRHLVTLDPKDAARHARLGNCLLQVRDYAGAVESYRAVTRLDPGAPEAWYNLSLALRHDDRTSEAREAVTRALELRPSYPAALLNLGILLEQEGDLDAAAAAYRKALEILPTCTAAYWSLANLRTVRFSAQEAEAMHRLADSDRGTPEDRIYLHFALAKDFEDRRLYPDAFEQLAKANAQKRSLSPYSRQFVEEQLAGIKETFTAAFLAQRSGVGLPGPKPIFIVGMPRSGTSLIEQILASHDEVAGGGELATAQQIAHGHLRDRYALPFFDAVRRLRPDEFAELGRLYCARNAELVRSKVRFTDKTPDNFILIGLLRLMFPNATFIHARRHPLDTCLSCYKQYFTRAQNFSYSLEDLAHYYRQYRALMDWWHAQSPGMILDVDYEALVSDQEAQSRRIVEFCALAWDERCLDFHETRRAVKTASAGQVRQALYATSVNQWKHYEPNLRPLVDALGDML
jgi:tetratricopeptide (TPR) repeat protein